jgi:hypothetical protein
MPTIWGWFTQPIYGYFGDDLFLGLPHYSGHGIARNHLGKTSLSWLVDIINFQHKPTRFLLVKSIVD